MIIKNIKKYILVVLLFAFIPLVYADDVKFDKNVFNNYFKNRGYELEKFECMKTSSFDKDCEIISAANINGLNNKTLVLYIFNDNDGAKKYFDYVYNSSVDDFKNTEIHNLENEDNSDYSYVKTELSGLYYFYLVRVDNYVVKSNIEKNNHKVMDKIYDGLGLIKNSNVTNGDDLKIHLNFSVISVGGIIIDVILIIILMLFILKIKGSKKKNNIVLILLGLVIVLSIFTFFDLFGFFIPDSKKIKTEYESLNNKKTEDNLVYPTASISIDNKIHYTNSKELVQILNDNRKVAIFFGYPECLYCRSAIGTFVDAANKSSVERVYYMDVKKEKNNSDDYKKLVKILGNSFMDDDEIYSPTVVFMNGKGIVFLNRNTVEMHDNPYLEFNDQFKEGLEEIYLYGFKLLKEAK